MADEAAKRREMRRQRILGNSENRLKRITKNQEKSQETDALCENLVENAAEVASDQCRVDEDPRDSARDQLGHEEDTEELNMAFNSLMNLMGNHSANGDTQELSRLLTATLQATMSNMNQTPTQGGRDFVNPDGVDGDVLSHLADMLGQTTATKQREPSKLDFLQDTGCSMRNIGLLVFAVLSRLILPFLPLQYALMFGPLYALKLITTSICFLFGIPAKSSMSFLFNILRFFGIRSSMLTFVQSLLSAIDLMAHDMSFYAFGFMVTHAICLSYG